MTFFLSLTLNIFEEKEGKMKIKLSIFKKFQEISGISANSVQSSMNTTWLIGFNGHWLHLAVIWHSAILMEGKGAMGFASS